MRDAPGRQVPTTSLASRLKSNAMLPITWQAGILYAVSFGGYVAFSVYLPAYLKTGHGLEASDASARMAGFVVVAVIMRTVGGILCDRFDAIRSEEHTSELQSLMRSSYAVFCLKNKKNIS